MTGCILRLSRALAHTAEPVTDLARDRGAAAAVVLALSLTAIAGLAGLGTEAANWYLTQRTMQGAADAAAHSGATALMNGASNAAAKTQACSVAINYGFSCSTTTNVHIPPGSGSHTGDNSAVEVSLSEQVPLMLSGVVLTSPPTVQGRSVALRPTQTSPPCVMSLDTASEASLSTTGTPALTLTGCSVYVNSAGANALSMGGGTITTPAAYVVGGVTGTGLTATNGTTTGVDPHPDPYGSVAVPSVPNNTSGQDCSTASKTINNYSLSGNKTDTFLKDVSNGTCVFHSGLTVNGGSTLNLCPGTYYVDGGTVNIQGGGVLNAPPTANTTPAMSSTLCGSNTSGGVTIILTNSTTGGNPANISIAANAIVNVTAPTSGTYSGLAFFQNRTACSGNTNACANTLGGGSTQNVQGAIYFPKNAVSYNGGASSGSLAAICTQLIAYTIQFQGNSNLASTCDSAGTAKINVTGSRLVE
jgi:Putative Flp pilus-assembly TadE/G-like